MIELQKTAEWYRFFLYEIVKFAVRDFDVQIIIPSLREQIDSVCATVLCNFD